MRKMSFVLCASILVAACNNSGSSWSNSDTQKFMNTCLQNARNAGADEQTANAHCNCTLGKIQKNYKSYAEADQKMTQEQVSAIEQQCLQEAQNKGNNGNKKGGILGGGGGGLGNGGSWSQDDQQKVMNECMNHVAMNLDNSIKQKFCNCFVGKMMQKYANYNELDRNTTVEEGKQITQECMNGLDDNGGNVNNNFHTTWTNDEEQKFMNTCLKNAMNAGAERQTATEHCSCTLKKIEAKYQSYNEANQKMTPDEVTAMERECNQEQNQ